MGRHERLIQVDVHRFEPQSPAIGHRLARVLDKVEHGALNLSRVHVCQPQSLLEAQRQLDATADQRRERQAGDELIEIRRLEPERLLACKGQELLDE
jgi:hypothetical protein